MELKRHFDLRIVLTVVYVFLLGIYTLGILNPAGATEIEVSADLRISSIDLDTGVATLHIKDNKLEAPDTIAGSLVSAQNKILIIGHSSTVFTNLNQIGLGDNVDYDYVNYRVVSIETLEKSKVHMDRIMRGEEQETLVLMTCAGEDLGGGDATHRLIVTAVKDNEFAKN